MLFLTVVATNYIPFALALRETIKAEMPASTLCVLVTDASLRQTQALNNVFMGEAEFISCEELPHAWLSDMRRYYSVLEFSSACKVLFLDYQFRMRGVEECSFIDPDMWVMGDLTSALRESRKDIGITYHALSPFPNDKYSPNERELVVSGAANGGLIYMKRSKRQLEALDWLVSKTKAHWFVAPECGLYADQHWLGFLPQFFGDVTHVLDNKAINIAYWNLHERPLTQKDGRIYVNVPEERPALLFHFSGFSLQGGKGLTRHECRLFDEITEDVLNQLVSRYSALLNEQSKRLKVTDAKGEYGFRTITLRCAIALAELLYGIEIKPVIHPNRRFARVRNLIDRWIDG